MVVPFIRKAPKAEEVSDQFGCANRKFRLKMITPRECSGNSFEWISRTNWSQLSFGMNSVYIMDRCEIKQNFQHHVSLNCNPVFDAFLFLWEEKKHQPIQLLFPLKIEKRPFNSMTIRMEFKHTSKSQWSKKEKHTSQKFRLTATNFIRWIH